METSPLNKWAHAQPAACERVASPTDTGETGAAQALWRDWEDGASVAVNRLRSNRGFDAFWDWRDGGLWPAWRWGFCHVKELRCVYTIRRVHSEVTRVQYVTNVYLHTSSTSSSFLPMCFPACRSTSHGISNGNGGSGFSRHSFNNDPTSCAMSFLHSTTTES